MAWIKAQNGNLSDVTSIHVQGIHSCDVKGRTQGFNGTFTLGTYSSNATAEKVKDEIEEWLGAPRIHRSSDEAENSHYTILGNGTPGVLTMPGKDHLKSPGPVKACVTCHYAALFRGVTICQTCGTGHTNWKPIGFVNCTVCGREGGPDASTICPSCRKKASRACEDCEKRGLIVCFACSSDTHSHWEQKTVPDVKVFPAHDASKPIYGVVKNKPGEIVEFVVGDETLTCKVLKVVRKGSHGIFTMELKE